MRRLLLLFFKISVLAFVMSYSSCGNTNMKERVENIIGKKIWIPQELINGEPPIKVVRYVRTSSCTSCKLELGLWRVYRKKLQNKFGENIQLNFIVDTKRREEATPLLSMYGFNNLSVIDTAGMFGLHNPKISDLGDDIVVIIDHADKVLMIGNPCKNHSIELAIDSIMNDILNNQEINAVKEQNYHNVPK